MTSITAIDFTSKSLDELHPTLAEYYSNLNLFVTLCLGFAIFLLIINVAIYCITALNLKRSLSENLRKHSLFLCTVYPIISLAAVVTILLPRYWFICHTVMHFCFIAAAVVFQRLLFRYVGSEEHYLKLADGEAVRINTPPCCCCCVCLPTVVPSKANFGIFKYMVRQMIFVQGSLMIVLMVLYYVDEDLHDAARYYCLGFIVVSILIGNWGMNLTIGLIEKVHTDYRLRKKSFCIQFIMIFCKFQYLLMDSQMDGLGMGEGYPMNNTIYKQTIINLVILVEMVFVSLFVHNAYKFPIEL